MKVLLDHLLPRLFPALEFLCIPHEGKSDLEKSLPRKLGNRRQPGDRFIVIRDNDGGDCKALKASLVQMCQNAGRSDTLVRIVCQELEAWYFGEPAAMAAAFGMSWCGCTKVSRKSMARAGWPRSSLTSITSPEAFAR